MKVSLRERWELLRRERRLPCMTEGDVGARLYGVYTDRRRGVTTISGRFISAASINARKITADLLLPTKRPEPVTAATIQANPPDVLRPTDLTP